MYIFFLSFYKSAHLRVHLKTKTSQNITSVRDISLINQPK